MKLIVKPIMYFGQPAVIACDAKCNKAWGINSRPKRQLSADEDDYEFLADGELGDAPIDPGTYEGRDAKPRAISEQLNKWCCRECERCSKTPPGGNEIRVKDFSKPRKNIPEGTNHGTASQN